ncbi:uncharacterized protein SPAPADRAFT_63491 [Spathaspora passalidarum NRRL Y-27907]|uniref:Uncharacterized protein n=1 Tax=Spathaspora passalidarum (strain NRRL Y-27907 / 11-Y1) TaxID=619300 RepID=G3AV68_SPAPN|nr:uncharacterized protein SPAPADRAFT_63491 [Spathaspora passalidarum NRRL Y-27907]EGW29871.1 hypothetical protein SPAPADRAFT_63491 [Spathaspora passalidarum NRRL Y-27907]
MTSPVSYANAAANGAISTVDIDTKSKQEVEAVTESLANTSVEDSSATTEESTEVKEETDDTTKESDSVSSSPSKEKAPKKNLLPAPVPAKSAWGQQKFIKPITNRWVPINAKVILPNTRGKSQQQPRRKKSANASQKTNAKKQGKDGKKKLHLSHQVIPMLVLKNQLVSRPRKNLKTNKLNRLNHNNKARPTVRHLTKTTKSSTNKSLIDVTTTNNNNNNNQMEVTTTDNIKRDTVTQINNNNNNNNNKLHNNRNNQYSQTHNLLNKFQVSSTLNHLFLNLHSKTLTTANSGRNNTKMANTVGTEITVATTIVTVTNNHQ